MINMPGGVAQFCDVPPGRDAPAPELAGRAALSCSFLDRDLDVYAVGPAQVRSSDGLAGVAVAGVSMGGPGRPMVSAQRAIRDADAVHGHHEQRDGSSEGHASAQDRAVHRRAARSGQNPCDEGHDHADQDGRRAAEHGHQPGHRPGMRVGGVELGILSHLGEEHLRGG